jgi:orotate phosphoribosyltransferase-like protein
MGIVKVTEKVMDKIVALRLAGMRQEEIAAELRLAQGTVSRVLRERGQGGKLMRRVQR